jgi:hypothetical protein
MSMSDCCELTWGSSNSGDWGVMASEDWGGLPSIVSSGECQYTFDWGRVNMNMQLMRVDAINGNRVSSEMGEIMSGIYWQFLEAIHEGTLEPAMDCVVAFASFFSNAKLSRSGTVSLVEGWFPQVMNWPFFIMNGTDNADDLEDYFIHLAKIAWAVPECLVTSVCVFCDTTFNCRFATFIYHFSLCVPFNLFYSDLQLIMFPLNNPLPIFLHQRNLLQNTIMHATANLNLNRQSLCEMLCFIGSTPFALTSYYPMLMEKCLDRAWPGFWQLCKKLMNWHGCWQKRFLPKFLLKPDTRQVLKKHFPLQDTRQIAQKFAPVTEMLPFTSIDMSIKEYTFTKINNVKFNYKIQSLDIIYLILSLPFAIYSRIFCQS